MKIVEMIGGLGNQMYQAALLISLRRAFPQETVKADVTQYAAYRLHNGYELDRIFSFQPEYADEKEIRALKFVFPNYLFSRAYRRLPNFFHKKTTCIEAQDMRFDSTVLTQAGARYFSGYWQDHRYFDAVKEEIRRQFTFPDFSDARNRELADRMRQDPAAVAIHVRRGDYVSNPLYRGICTEKYFINAINALGEVGKKARFYLFSNDPQWCTAVLRPLLKGESCTLVDWNCGKESFRDMQLMSCCGNMILSNSTFSWWSAYLNAGSGTRILAPEKWLNANFAAAILLPGWQSVSIS